MSCSSLTPLEMVVCSFFPVAVSRWWWCRCYCRPCPHCPTFPPDVTPQIHNTRLDKVRHNDIHRAPLDYLSADDIDRFYEYHKSLTAIIRCGLPCGLDPPRFLVSLQACKGRSCQTFIFRVKPNNGVFSALEDCSFGKNGEVSIAL